MSLDFSVFNQFLWYFLCLVCTGDSDILEKKTGLSLHFFWYSSLCTCSKFKHESLTVPNIYLALFRKYKFSQKDYNWLPHCMFHPKGTAAVTWRRKIISSWAAAQGLKSKYLNEIYKALRNFIALSISKANMTVPVIDHGAFTVKNINAEPRQPTVEVLDVLYTKIHKRVKHSVSKRFLIFISLSIYVYVASHKAPNIVNNSQIWGTSSLI